MLFQRKNYFQQNSLFINFVMSWMFLKFRRFHEKTPVLESLFNKIAVLNPQVYQETLAQVFSCEFWEIFKKNFYRILPGDCFCWSMVFATFSNLIVSHSPCNLSQNLCFWKVQKKKLNNTLQLTHNGSNHQVMFLRMRVSKKYAKNLSNTGKGVHF